MESNQNNSRSSEMVLRNRCKLQINRAYLKGDLDAQLSSYSF